MFLNLLSIRSFCLTIWKGVYISLFSGLFLALTGCSSNTDKYYSDSSLPDDDLVTIYGSYNNPAPMAKEIISIEEVDGQPVSDNKLVKIPPGMHEIKVVFFWKRERWRQEKINCTFMFNGAADHEYVIRGVTENLRKSATREYLTFNYRFWVEDKTSKEMVQDCRCREYEMH